MAVPDGPVALNHDRFYGWQIDAPEPLDRRGRKERRRGAIVRYRAGLGALHVFEVREGAPHPFTLTLPAGSYRFVDAENSLSGGMERQSAQLDAQFEVTPGETVYIGRLLLYVRSVVAAAAAAVDVADCREIDVVPFRAREPAAAPVTVAGTALLHVAPIDGDETPPPFAGCDAPRAP